MRSYVSLDSYTDGLGQEVKVGDTVLYPRMRWSSPRVTVGKIVNIRQREGQGWLAKPYTTVRVASVSECHFGANKAAYPDASFIVTLAESTVRNNYKNLVKIDPNMVDGVLRSILFENKTLVVYSKLVDNKTRFIRRYFTKDDNGVELDYVSPL